MDSNGCCPCLFDSSGKFHAVFRIPCPAKTHLDRDRSVAVLNDLLHRAAHIDIDDIRTRLCHLARPKRHDFRIASEKLESYRMFIRIDLQHVFCLSVFIIQPLGADHFRCSHGCAEAPCYDTVRQIADARHRSQYGPAVKLDSTYDWFIHNFLPFLKNMYIVP